MASPRIFSTDPDFGTNFWPSKRLPVSAGQTAGPASRSTTPSPPTTRAAISPPSSIMSSASSSTAVSGAPVSGVTDRRMPQGTVLDLGHLFVQIIVGKETNERAFYVHESILTSRSEYFKCALSFMWRNDPTKPVTLSEDDPDMFALYVNLVYSGHLATRGTDEWLKLVRLYVLAEKLQDVRAKNDTVDAMHAFIRESLSVKLFRSASADDAIPRLMSAESIVELYDGTPAGNHGRSLVVDLYVEIGREDWLTDGKELLPADFIFDLAAAVLRKRPACLFGQLQQRPSSHYHDMALTKLEPTPSRVPASLPKNDSEVVPMVAVDETPIVAVVVVA